MDLAERFTQIYHHNVWQYGSGEGSLPQHTAPYRRFLQRFLREKGIRSVVDLGCGDWQTARLIDWDGIDYLGIDVVAPLIEQNRRLYGRENIRFLAADITTCELPQADLGLIKDVFQHWPNQLILDFWPRLRCFRYALITNCILPITGETVNADIQPGEFRPLDLNAAPFNLGLKKVFEFTNARGPLPFRRKVRWKKAVMLYISPDADGAKTAPSKGGL